MTPIDDSRLHRMLAEVHRLKAEDPAGDGWKTRTLMRIREMDPSRHFTAEFAAQFLWRFAGAAGVAAAVLAVYILQTDLQPEMDLAKLYFETSLDFGLLTAIGLI